MHKVNLFVVGAPKCGTTALASYLTQSEDVFFPVIKEPHYFCSDFPKIRRAKTERQYHSLYPQKPDNSQRYKGDASVWYLYSKQAAKKIYEYNKDSKIIIMIRNPLTMLPSLHNQLVFSGRESEKDFLKAWQLCGDRKVGLKVPQTSLEPSHLFYDEVCKYYEQIERYREIFPLTNIKIIEFESFFQDVSKGMKEVYEFLGLSTPDYATYPVVNQAREHRYPRLMKFLQYPPFPLSILKGNLKKLDFVRRNPPLRGLYAKYSVDKKVSENIDAVRSSIENVYEDDIFKCRESLGLVLARKKVS